MVEGLYFLSILATDVTERQMAQYLCNKNVIQLFIVALKKQKVQTRLIKNVLEALHAFFKWDVEHYSACSGLQESVIEYFDSEGGFEAL